MGLVPAQQGLSENSPIHQQGFSGRDPFPVDGGFQSAAGQTSIVEDGYQLAAQAAPGVRPLAGQLRRLLTHQQGTEKVQQPCHDRRGQKEFASIPVSGLAVFENRQTIRQASRQGLGTKAPGLPLC
jgi:hypothetical protein